MIEITRKNSFSFIPTDNINKDIHYSTNYGKTASNSPVFDSIKQTLAEEKLVPLLNSDLIELVPFSGEEVKFVVAGGFFRNYLDKQNRLFVKTFDDSISDVDIFLLPSVASVKYNADMLGAQFISQNDFKFAVGPAPNNRFVTYSTLCIEFNGTKYQFISMTYIDDFGDVYGPSDTTEIINGFDFICCMAGIEFMLWEASSLHRTLFTKDIVMHPDFPLAVANKLLLINPNTLLPVSLERYTKYVHEYGYTPRKQDMNKLREMLGIPENFGSHYE